MSWILFTLIAAFLWAIVNIWSKHVVNDELKDPRLCSTIYGLVFFIIGLVIAIFYRIDIIMSNGAIIAMIIGVIATLATLFYFTALEEGEVSKVVSFFVLTPFIVLALGMVFLNEYFGIKEYFGIFVLVCGALLISVKKKKLKSKEHIARVIFIVLASSLFFSIRDVMTRYSFQKMEFIQVFFWISVGAFIASTILFVLHHPHILKKSREIQGIEHLFMISALTTIAFLSFVKAISLKQVALVTSLVYTRSFLVLFLAVLLKKQKPEIIKSHMEKSNIYRKILGSLLLFIGSTLIIL